VRHAGSPQAVANYKVEPYVVAADVYAVAPHTGRGGWTWYTGSAGWMYRLIIESLLGLELQVDKLRIKPCIPAGWESFKIRYRFRETRYHITVHQASAGDTMDNDTAGGDTADDIKVDGTMQRDDFIALVNDGQEHQVEIRRRRTKA
jgi:cellobiose phosphorylase